MPPAGMTTSGHVTGNATLEGATSVDGSFQNGARVHTTLANGSSVSLDGNVTKDASGLSADGSVKAHATLGSTTVEKGGVTLAAPSGGLDLSVAGKTGPGGTSGHFKADASLGDGTKVDVKNGPYGSSAHTTLAAGSHLGLAGDLAGNSLKGTLTGQVNANGLDASAGPAAVHLPADAKVGVTAPFDASLNNGAITVNSAKATVPIRVDLHKGTSVTVTLLGKTGSITLDTEGTYVELTAQADIVNGRPVIRSLDNCTVNTVLGDVAAAALGHQLGFTVDKRLTFKGGAAFWTHALSVHGSLSADQKGSTASYFTFTW